MMWALTGLLLTADTEEQIEARGGPATAGTKGVQWSEWRKGGGRAEPSPAQGEVAENTRGCGRTTQSHTVSTDLVSGKHYHLSH